MRPMVQEKCSTVPTNRTRSSSRGLNMADRLGSGGGGSSGGSTPRTLETDRVSHDPIRCVCVCACVCVHVCVCVCVCVHVCKEAEEGR